ncbi:MAG: hypothetical protein ACRDN9_07945 [Streptosporangiaceae bacterium]
MNEQELERLIDEETEASERTRGEPLSDRAKRRRPTRTEVYSVRLTPEEVAEIQRIADDAEIPASGLVRDWVRQGLAAERDGSVADLVEALSHSVERLKRQVVEGASPGSARKAS